jgi:hypothetical protein
MASAMFATPPAGLGLIDCIPFTLHDLIAERMDVRKRRLHGGEQR